MGLDTQLGAGGATADGSAPRSRSHGRLWSAKVALAAPAPLSKSRRFGTAFTSSRPHGAPTMAKGTGLHRCRHFKWLAIRSCQQAIGFGIVAAHFCLGIKTDRSAGAESNVSQVAQARAFVAFLDVSIGPANTCPR